LTRVDFYLPGPDAPDNRFGLACRLADKAYRQGRRVYLHAASAEQARHLDRLLWTFREQSFVPHGLTGQVDPVLTPVLLGWQAPPEDENDVLINLAPEVPAFFSRFRRLAEPLDDEPGIREAGRERYRFYRDRGYPLETHQIGA
jgi:DNA polymerase-3 subunit chi